jgi:hypothetical protein
MAAHSGLLSADILYPDTVPFCSDSIISNSPTSTTFSVMDLDEVSLSLSGSKVSNLPISEREKSQTGHEQVTFRNDYYYRIHVDPQTIAFGAILSPESREFLVWNAWFETKSCSVITKTNPTEYVLTGDSAPFDLNALESITYDVDVTEEGSTEFTATITFDFGAETPVVSLSGTRVITFVWYPLLALVETLEWLTQIIKGKSGLEQRISLRRIPRQGFQVPVYFDDEQAQARFEAAIFSWQKRTWGVPVWPEGVEHSGTISAGTTAITVDTTNADFRDDSLAIIYVDEDNYEVVKIETKTDSVLNLEVGTQNAFSGDKLIVPVRIANMTTPVRMRQHPDGFAYMDCQFLVTINELLTGYTADETYDGLTVLTGATYVDPAVDLESDADIVMSDCGTGPFDVFSDSEFNVISQSHLFKNWDKADCWNFRLFLHHLYGRQIPVWSPTFKNDLQLTDTIGSSDVNFRVSNIGLADNMGVNNLRTHIAFMFPDGTNYYREITGIVESGTEEIITIDSSLGLEVQIGDCEICFLDKYRLANDKVSIKWKEPFVNECRLKFVRVEE